MEYKLCFSPLLMITAWTALYISMQRQVQNKEYNDMQKARRTTFMRKDCSDEEGHLHHLLILLLSFKNGKAYPSHSLLFHFSSSLIKLLPVEAANRFPLKLNYNLDHTL